jgi:hypothetical protein
MSVKSATGFTPFQLVYGIEVILPIECEIPSLNLAVKILPNTTDEEECMLYLMQLDKTRPDVTLVIETQKKCVKAQYDKHVKPCVFLKAIWFFFMTKIMTCWGQVNSSPCGVVLISLNKYYRKRLMSLLIMMGFLWVNPEMGFT